MNGFSSLRVATRMQILVGLALIGLLVLCVERSRYAEKPPGGWC